MLAANKHLPVVKPRRLPQHTSYELERLALKTVSCLVRTDGSLLFIVHLDYLINQIKHEGHNAANGANVSNHRPKCRSYMYRLPGIDFP